MLKYTIILVLEDKGGYSVEVPALPRCYTQGKTRKEAFSMAKETIELFTSNRAKGGEKLALQKPAFNSRKKEPVA